MLGHTLDKQSLYLKFWVCGYLENVSNYYTDRYCDHLAGPVIFVALDVLLTKFGSSNHLQ
jgi:hypothetical protein